MLVLVLASRHLMARPLEQDLSYLKAAWRQGRMQKLNWIRTLLDKIELPDRRLHHGDSRVCRSVGGVPCQEGISNSVPDSAHPNCACRWTMLMESLPITTSAKEGE